MKRYGLRILIGLTAFTIGATFVWIISYKSMKADPLALWQNEEVTKTQTLYPTTPNGKIEIRFIGFGKLENRPTLKFKIINHNSNSVKYNSIGEKHISTFVKFNGDQKKEWRCGFGFREFSLASGDSFEIEFEADYQIYEFLKKDGFFEFGYGFYSDEKGSQMFWSKPMIISDELKQEIIENAPKLLKQEIIENAPKLLKQYR